MGAVLQGECEPRRLLKAQGTRPLERSMLRDRPLLGGMAEV